MGNIKVTVLKGEDAFYWSTFQNGWKSTYTFPKRQIVSGDMVDGIRRLYTATLNPDWEVL